MSKCTNFLLFLTVIFTVFTPAVGPVPEASAEQTGAFSGTWIASGQLWSLEFAVDREVGNFKLSGHVNLKDEVGEVEDYWAECVGLSDSVAGSAARCVWRSLKGDKAYSVLSGKPLVEGSKISGEFVGGTGRLKGLKGSFSFTWISTFTDINKTTFTGHTKDLKGTYRLP